MKNCKKLGVLLLALIMVTTSGVMSFADGDAAAPSDGTTTGTAAEATTEPAAGGEQTESQDVVEHEHNLSACQSCNGTGEIGEAQDCPDCDGPIGDDVMVTCTRCSGEGLIKETYIAWGTPCPNVNCDGFCQYCVWGNAKVTTTRNCEDCSGTGKVLDPNAKVCASCEGKGLVTVNVDCPDCENGKIPCNGKFDEAGILTSVNNDNGTGVVTHTCSACGAFYETKMKAEDVPAALAASLRIGELTSADPGARAGETVHCSMEVENQGKCPVSGVKLVFTLDKELNLKEDSVTVDKDGYAVEIKESEVVLTLAPIEENETHKISFSIKLPKEALPGTIYDLVLDNATLGEGQKVAEIELPEDNAESLHVNKYGKCTVTLNGHKLGREYGYGPEVNITKNFGSLDDLEGKEFRFENFDSSLISCAESVINRATLRRWRCIGFIPSDDMLQNSRLKQLVFSNEASLGFETKTIDEVKTYITEEKKGILYGDTADEEQLKNWESKFCDYRYGEHEYLYIQPVWYVEGKAVSPVLDAIPYIDRIALATASNDVTCEAQNIKGWVTGEHEFYEADLVVTIGENAPSEIHVNLAEAIAKASEVFNEIPEKAVQPGDTIKYRIIINNESKNKYIYKEESGVLATPNTVKGNETTDWIGFDGFKIHQSDSLAEMSMYPRRINNVPLRELGLYNKLDDESIGKALKELGYGTDENDLAEVTKKYLGNYYLDWTNGVRAAKGETEMASSFQDLSTDEFAVLTNGDTGSAYPIESCRTVVDALYYYYYNNVLTFNGKSLYEHMKDCKTGNSELETAIPAAMNGTTYPLNVTVDYFAANNAFQNTEFDFRLEFDLKASDPEPDPTPDPTPTPTPTPDPTPEPDPTPDPQPLPPDDPLEEPDKPTVDPQPLPSDDPLIEDEDPKQPLPEDEHLADPDQPKTGDESDLALWLGMMILASGAVVTMRVKRKKEDQN